MLSWMQCLESPKPQDHVAQLYGADEQCLVRNVSRYLAEGLKQGDGLLVIATPEHTDAIIRQLEAEGADIAGVLGSGQFVCLDARVTLERFLADGQPDRQLFERAVGGVLREVQAHAGSGHIRAFGEMVGLLWRDEHFAAAIRIEEYWNEFMKENIFSLFCAYPIDIYRDDFQMRTLSGVLGTHTHLLVGPQAMLSSVRAAD